MNINESDVVDEKKIGTASNEVHLTNKKELGDCIQAVLDAMAVHNELLMNLALKNLNNFFSTLPDNWIKN